MGGWSSGYGPDMSRDLWRNFSALVAERLDARGCRRPASTISATTARQIATQVVSPPRKLQATPSCSSCARTTGLRAQDCPRVSCQAKNSSPAPYATKNSEVVTPIVTRSEDRLAVSSTPKRTISSPSTATSEAATTRGGGLSRTGAFTGTA